VKHLAEFFGEASHQVKENLVQRNRLALLKLSALLHDVGKPETRAISEETGRITFYGHDVRGAELADETGRRLMMPNEDRKLFGGLVREHLHVLNLSNPNIKRHARVRWFRKLGDDAVLTIILGMADRKGTLGPDSSEEERNRHIQWSKEAVIEYYRSIKSELERKDILTGRDLIELGMRPGPEMGKVLKAVREAQDEGVITDRASALALARDLFSAFHVNR
jgi:putative nucleotidyltransferase with HDIG domain